MKDYDRGGTYLKEIDHVSILEPIDEIFDGASSLMTENAVMYGSSVTHVLAGLPIVGDLDIAVSNQEYMVMCQNFASSVKWVQVSGNNIPERSAPRGGGRVELKSSYPPSLSSNKKNPYAKAKHLPISNMVAFETVNRARVQLIESKAMTGDMLEDALSVVRKVDLTFCGMALDKYGRLLETIEHAYEDCLNRIIRIQDYQPRLDGKRLKQRMMKYTKRGWHLSIAMDQALLNLKRAQVEHMLNKKKKSGRKKRIKANVPGFRIRQTVGKGVMIVIERLLLDMSGSRGFPRDVVKHYASRDYNISLSSRNGKNNCIEMYATKKSDLTVDIARSIADRSLKHLESDRGVDIERLAYEARKQRALSKYNTPQPGSSAFTNTYYNTTYTNSSTGSGWNNQ